MAQFLVNMDMLPNKPHFNLANMFQTAKGVAIYKNYEWKLINKK